MGGNLIDAKGKLIKNKIVKGKRTKKGITIIEEKTIADSAKLQLKSTLKSLSSKKVYRAMRRNECSNASFVKSTIISKLIVVKRNLQARTIAVIRIKLLKTRK